MKKTILMLMVLSLSGLSFAGGKQDSKERLTNAWRGVERDHVRSR